MASHVVIVGTSVRAAAQSAAAAGYRVTGIDLFADQDLAECATAIRCDDYPRGLARLAETADAGPWMYTGALENYPRLVDHMAARRKLLGNPGDVLRRVRDPLLLYRTLTEAGLPCPDVAIDATGLPTDGTWLEKARKSGGGTSVRRYRGQPARGEVYYQRYIAGTPVAAAYVAGEGTAVLLGVTEQLIGVTHIPGENFRYIGSIGPLYLSSVLIASLKNLGNQIASDFTLTGLFGIDGIVANDTVWPVEINPRYTASMEIVERTFAHSVVGLHVEAAMTGQLPTKLAHASGVLYGKVIAYATKDIVVDSRLADLAERMKNGDTTLADISPLGTHIAVGSPLATVLSRATNRDHVTRNLTETVTQLLSVFGT
jgi:predicted ATP-grasp superfamily ATP-dependent carboligase